MKIYGLLLLALNSHFVYAGDKADGAQPQGTAQSLAAAACSHDFHLAQPASPISAAATEASRNLPKACAAQSVRVRRSHSSQEIAPAETLDTITRVKALERQVLTLTARLNALVYHIKEQEKIRTESDARLELALGILDKDQSVMRTLLNAKGFELPVRSRSLQEEVEMSYAALMQSETE